MRKRYQQGSLTKVNGNWIAQWWEDGHRRKRTLGRLNKVAKAQAQAELNAILGPINSRAAAPSSSTVWGDFVNNVYLPFYRRKWKLSTRLTNEDRFRVHFNPIYGERSLGSFSRDELQDLLDAKTRGCRTASWRICGGTCGRCLLWPCRKAIYCVIRQSCCSFRGKRSGLRISP